MVVSIISPLFVPADRPDRFAKAAASGADAVILDLEDAVAPAKKEQARRQLSTDFSSIPVLVRINAPASPWYADDIAVVASLRPAGVILPKAENPTQIAELVDALEGIPVFALIETALGLHNACVIARQHGVARLAFGSLDFCGDLGCDHDRETLRQPRFELVRAARLAGKAAPLDGVTVRLDRESEASEDARHAKSLGMGGKLCIHPRQIAPVREAFLPSREDIAWARRVLDAKDAVARVEGEMVDAPVRKRARDILSRASICTLSESPSDT